MKHISPDTVRIRTARSSDEQRVTAMVSKLSMDSIHRRFMAGVARDVALDELRREVRGGYRTITLIAEDAAGTIVGEAYAALVGDGCAEAAFVVADRNQHHGIGMLLFAGIVRELTAQGVQTMRIETFAQNSDMLHLIDNSNLAHTQQRLDDTVVTTLRISSTTEVTPSDNFIAALPPFRSVADELPVSANG